MQTLMNLKERTQWVIDHVAERDSLSNAEIGASVGSKPDTVRKYRSGQAIPRLNFLQRFCDCYGVDFRWLSKGEGEPFPEKNIQFTGAPDVTRPEPDEPGEAPADDFEKESPIQKMAPPPEKTPSVLGELEEFLHESGGDAEDSPSSAITGMDCEMSFQKLAILAGIKIGSEWIYNLSRKIGIESWKISLSIYHQKMDKELVQHIEGCGYERHDWLVKLEAGNAAPENGNGNLDIAQLLKITEEVLRSNTIHSTSLSLNIISLKMLADQKTSAPVMGPQAVILSRKNTNLFM